MRTTMRISTLLFCSLATAGCLGSLELGNPADDAISDGSLSEGSDGGTSIHGKVAADLPAPSAYVMAETLCESYVGCGCDVSSVDECLDRIAPAWEDAFQLAEQIGAEIQEECYRSFMEFHGVEAPNCDLSGPGLTTKIDEAWTCDLFAGSRDLGARCSSEDLVMHGASDCRPGLACLDGICRALPREGEACATSGWAHRRCERGTVCDEGICIPAPEPGEPCVGSLACDVGEACMDGYCQPKGLSGDTCNRNVHCESGQCLDTGICSAPRPLVCSASTERQDPADGLYCDCYAVEGAGNLQELVNHCDSPRLCSFQLVSCGPEDDCDTRPLTAEDEAGLQCALQALRDRRAGGIEFSTDTTTERTTTTIHLIGDGTAYIAEVPGSDAAPSAGSVAGFTLHQQEYFEVCLRLPVEDQVGCIFDLGQEGATCENI